MKPRILGLLAGLASLGFAWWLLRQPHSSRELFLCMIAWVLGFWVATGIRRSLPESQVGGPDGERDEEDEEEEEA